MKITISDKIREVCPQLALSIVQCEINNSLVTTSLSDELDAEIRRLHTTLSLDEINKRPEIAATRRMYKLLGKDPNRYRPSAEALCRRIVREIDIYRVSTVVDIINLVSIHSGFSIGGFDQDKITGDIELGVGTVNDYFEAIGRGVLNVEGLPLYRDAVGGIGTPTSDNERTKISENTKRLLMIINSYNGENGLKEATDHALELLKKYAGLKQPVVTLIT